MSAARVSVSGSNMNETFSCSRFPQSERSSAMQEVSRAQPISSAPALCMYLLIFFIVICTIHFFFLGESVACPGARYALSEIKEMIKV